MTWIDTHCHLDAAEFDTDRKAVVSRGRAAGVNQLVLPAVARNKRPDPVFLLAGGPGQSAIDLAAPMGRLLSRMNNRRDIVLVDQRGTGRSSPLKCAMPEPTAPLAEATMAKQLQDRSTK